MAFVLLQESWNGFGFGGVLKLIFLDDLLPLMVTACALNRMRWGMKKFVARDSTDNKSNTAYVYYCAN